MTDSKPAAADRVSDGLVVRGRPPFAMTPTSLLRNPSVSSHAVRLWSVLASYTYGDQATDRPSRSQLANDVGWRQLKHVSIVTTEGYAARPGGQQASFVAELAAEENAEHLRLTVAAYHDYQRGVLPTGRGARDLVASFHAVDEILARHEPGPATVVDDRRVEGLLRATSRTLHVGVANYCWFTDPGKALCLQLAGTPEADQPLIGMCDSARCPQATHHPQHRAAWAAHAQHTEAVFLGNPRLSKPERARAQAVLDRATRIVAEIDTATGRPEDPVHGC